MSPSTPVDTLYLFLNNTWSNITTHASSIPGSAIAFRYIKSSYQNDPFRTLLEVGLIIFAIRLLLASRYDKDLRRKNKLRDNEIDELVEEWRPEPIVKQLTNDERVNLDSTPVIVGPTGTRAKLATGEEVLNFSAFNFLNFAENQSVKDVALKTLRNYGVGACGPSGFYGTLDVHMQFEKDVAEFIGTENAIIYAQAFSTISSVIPAFAKRGDLVVADKGSNFAIQKGIQISRCNVLWYEHNDMNDLERVLQSVAKEDQRRKRRGPLTRRFIVTEGLSENFGDIVDLPRLIELKNRFKHRLILDESLSFGVLGKHGRGLTEYYGVNPKEVEFLTGSMATAFCASGGFCAGSEEVISHQIINGPAYVFSAALPPMFATTSSRCIDILKSDEGQSTILKLNENTSILRGILDTVNGITISSAKTSPVIHIRLNGDMTVAPVSNTPRQLIPPTPKTPSATTTVSSVVVVENILQDIVDEAQANGVLIARQRHNWEQEVFEQIPAIRLGVSSGHTRAEVERAGNVIKAAIEKYVR